MIGRPYNAVQRQPADVTVFSQMRCDVGTIVAWAVRAQGGRGPHAELARAVVLAVLLGRLLAAAQHEGPPHAARRPPRDARAQRVRPLRRESLAGRRPRG
jgi:hypothetical protein